MIPRGSSRHSSSAAAVFPDQEERAHIAAIHAAIAIDIRLIKPGFPVLEEDIDIGAINATILVEKVSQRAILIGKQGQFIKKIGTEARQDIEEMLGHRVYLELHVKVSEDWRMNPRVLHELEYDQ